jgi:hypothetical protein
MLFVAALPSRVEDYIVSAAGKVAPVADMASAAGKVAAVDTAAVAAVEEPTERAFELRNYRRIYRSGPGWLRN